MTDFIRNEEYLRQPTDFSGFSIRGQDIDFECDWGGKIFLRADWKHKGGSLSGGQRHAATNWLSAIGETRHAYFAIAEHEVESPKTITADDLTVCFVMFKTPSMKRHTSVRYDEDHRISWNLFTGSLALRYAFYGQLTDHACFDEEWWLDPALAAAHDTDFARQNREAERLKMQDFLNHSTPYKDWSFPPDLKTSEDYLQDYLKQTSIVAADLPSHIVA